MAKLPRLDAIDLKILAALQTDGRMTNQRLSERVGLSPRPCLERVRRLEDAGIIHHYMAVLNVNLLPGAVSAFAEITLKNQSSQALARFEACIGLCREVVECHLIGGEYDYLAHIACPSLARYNELTTQWIDDPELPVARIVSNFIMRPVRHFTGFPVENAAAG
jgi:DNA-binding Lrp family transcriptional regulator